jgi:hypothetical protein
METLLTLIILGDFLRALSVTVCEPQWGIGRKSPIQPN